MTNRNTEFFDALTAVSHRPAAFETYTAHILWNDEHISKNMLAYHLNEDSALASRPPEFIQRSAEWIIDRFGLSQGKRVADFGCGPGLYARRFAEAGAAVTGVDFSRRSIAYAREEAQHRNLKIEYVESNYLDYEAENNVDLITLIYCDLCALSPAQRGILLGKFKASLSDDGSVLLDVFSLNAYAERTETSQFGRRTMGGW